MAAPQAVYWRKPCIIVNAFILDIAFAIGHHGFYQSLDGLILEKGVVNYD
jgi:hypothetical protein